MSLYCFDFDATILIFLTDDGKISEARKWEVYVFPMGSNPHLNLHQWGLKHLLGKGWNMDIQVMVVLRNKFRPKKRQRSDFQTATFSFVKTEEEKLKKKAKKKYSEFLDTLDMNSLKMQVETPSFGRNTENITVTTATLDEGNAQLKKEKEQTIPQQVRKLKKV